MPPLSGTPSSGLPSNMLLSEENIADVETDKVYGSEEDKEEKDGVISSDLPLTAGVDGGVGPPADSQS